MHFGFIVHCYLLYTIHYGFIILWMREGTLHHAHNGFVVSRWHTIKEIISTLWLHLPEQGDTQYNTGHNAVVLSAPDVIHTTHLI